MGEKIKMVNENVIFQKELLKFQNMYFDNITTLTNIIILSNSIKNGKYDTFKDL